MGESPLGCGSALPTVDLARMSDGSNHLFLVRHRHRVQLRSMISGMVP
jgi:hypothetical protein